MEYLKSRIKLPAQSEIRNPRIRNQLANLFANFAHYSIRKTRCNGESAGGEAYHEKFYNKND